MNCYGLVATDAHVLMGMLPKRMPVILLQQGTPFKRIETKATIIAWGTRAFTQARIEIEASPLVSVFILDTRMRFRGTNIKLLDLESPITEPLILSVLKKQTPPITFKKPPSVIRKALQENRDNSILGLMLHAKYRVSRSPERQKALQRAFVHAIMHKDFAGLRLVVPEPLLSTLTSIIQGEAGANLAKAVKEAQKGTPIAKAAQANDVTTFDVQYLLAYLNSKENQ